MKAGRSSKFRRSISGTVLAAVSFYCSSALETSAWILLLVKLAERIVILYNIRIDDSQPKEEIVLLWIEKKPWQMP